MLFKKYWKLGFSSDPRKLPALKGIHTTEEFSRILRRERERADRNGHQFSLIFFEVNHKDRTCRGLIDLAEALSRRIRLTDEAGWLDGHLAVFLPETPPDGAGKVADDICRIVELRSTLPRYHLYCYPLHQRQERPLQDRAERPAGEEKHSRGETPPAPKQAEKLAPVQKPSEKLGPVQNGGVQNGVQNGPALKQAANDEPDFLKNRLAGTIF